MEKNTLEEKINSIKNDIGIKSPIVVKNFYIGKDMPIEAAIIYVDGLVNKDLIDRDLLNPLMLYVQENLKGKEMLAEYLCKRYISMSNTVVTVDMNLAAYKIKRGKTVVLLENADDFIVIDTSGGEYRQVSESQKETSIRGSREGFVEKLETNVSLLRRKIRDKNLVVENFTLGRRGQSDLALLYIEDIADKTVINTIKARISAIDVDIVPCSGIIEQYIEPYPYTLFPQSRGTERPDIIEANLMEGKIAIILEGTPYVLIVPVVFTGFFQTVEDYYERTIIASFGRFLRFIAVFIVITMPAIYLSFIKFNADLVPLKFIEPIVQSRKGIALTPIMEILSMELTVELLREGGLRLPPKISQTLSVVGGIIIGDAAIRSKIVSPTTLLIVGIAVVATFLIPNYDMALAIRFIRFPMLIMANTFGVLGITTVWFIIIIHLCSLESFGVPYFEFKKSDLKDSFVRAPLWKMNKRPEIIPNKNKTRQTDFGRKFRVNSK